jgi:serine protease Do
LWASVGVGYHRGGYLGFGDGKEGIMSYGRLVSVLVVALGIIVVAGVAVPILLNRAVPAGGPGLSASLSAAEQEPLPPIPADVDRLQEAFRAVAKRVKPAVVAIGVSQTVEAPGIPFGSNEFLRRFFGFEPDERGGPTRKFERQGLGSGVIVDSGGYILTNNHVVAEADQITVHLADGREFKAKVIGTDPATDIAVIHIKAEHLPVAQLGNSDKVEVGDLVLAIGSPFALEQTVTMGIISATGRAGIGITDYENFLQTDAAINPGNSGGPLVNMRGQVIGVNTAIASRSGGYMGVGFSVPISLASEVTKRIRETGKVVRGWLGVTIQHLTPELAQSMKLKSDEGVLISQVNAGGPAAKAGLRDGDVVVEYNGKPVKAPYDLQSAVAWTAPGTTAALVVIRDGKRVTLRAEVEKRPSRPELARAERSTGPTELKELGLQVSSLTPEAAQRYGYRAGQGVLISEVEPGSPAGRAGLKRGMLIIEVGGQKVAGVAEFRQAVRKADLAKGVPMLVRSGDRQMFVVLK